MNRVFEIVQEKQEILKKLNDLAKRMVGNETAREKRIVEMTPPDGKWPGGNADDRKVNRDLALFKDEQMQHLAEEKRAIQSDIDGLTLLLTHLRHEERAIELFIRNQLVVMLGGKDVFAEVLDWMGEAKLTEATESEAISDLAEEHNLEVAGLEREPNPLDRFEFNDKD